MDSTDRKLDCPICQKHRGEIPVPGGLIYQDNAVLASHAWFVPQGDSAYLGWLVVETRRHIPGLADLVDEEAQAIGLLVARLSRLLKRSEGAEHIYAFVLGHQVPHLHIHLLPRYPGTPREFWGVRIDEWPQAPRGSEAEISALCDRLREGLAP